MSLFPITSRLDHIDDHQLQRLISLWLALPLDTDREAQRIAQALKLEQQRHFEEASSAGNRPETSSKLSFASRWRLGRR
jgi:hypothetical protein